MQEYEVADCKFAEECERVSDVRSMSGGGSYSGVGQEVNTSGVSWVEENDEGVGGVMREGGERSEWRGRSVLGGC